MTSNAAPRSVEELAEVHHVLERNRQARSHLRARARKALGFDGTGEIAGGRTAAASRYPFIALAVLAASSRLHAVAFLLLAPDIGLSLGMGGGTVLGLAALHIAVASLSSLVWAGRLRTPRRGRVALLGGIGRAIAVLGLAFVATAGGLFTAVVVHAFASGTVSASHPSLLAETYPPAARMRILALHRSAMFGGAAAGAILVILLISGFGLTWRFVAVAAAGIAILACALASRLQDPGFGRWEAETVGAAAGAPETPENPAGLRLRESLRHVMAVPTMRRLLTAVTLGGAAGVPAIAFVGYLARARWNVGPVQIAGLLAGLSLSCAAGLLIQDRFAARASSGPTGALLRSGRAAAIGGVLVMISMLLPASFILFTLIAGGAAALMATTLAAIDAAAASTVRPGVRPHGAAITACFAGAVGGPMALLVLGGLPSLIGPSWSIVILAIIWVMGALLLAGAGNGFEADIERRATEAIELQQLRAMDRSPAPPPLLTCHGIDAAYETVPVLFEVDFVVEEGEAVCLLGTNGAGKSTLLRVIAGLLPASRGIVRFDGQDVTMVEPERLVRRGIVTIPPGRSVFGSLSVTENLRAFGHTFLEDRAALERSIDRSLATFPLLAARADHRASTLSGGERQMLALAKAFILRPRLLLIDELTLGLAPGADVHLYAAVRSLADSGTAVVLVEQSVNVSLSLVHRAYFMERGRVRFQGRPEELLERKDLLRPVFLGGAVAEA